IVRADPRVSHADKVMLRIQGLPRRAGETRCPQRAPELRFVGAAGCNQATAGIGGTIVHVLEYRDVEVIDRKQHTRSRRSRPSGAARLELYFDLVPPGTPIPTHPAELSGWPRYLRSFSKNRMEV